MQSGNPIARISLVAIPAFLCGACTGGADLDIQQRIERVEHGIVPAVVARGEQTVTVSTDAIMDRFGVPGVSVAVINNGVIEWAKGYGVSEAGGADVNTETLFLAGQMSQSVAAISALELVQGGRIGLDEDINASLLTWHIPDNEFTHSDQVTLRRILTHTSGLSMSHSLGYLQGEPLPTLAQILDGEEPASNEPVRVLAAPGSGQQYSIGGYVVLQNLLQDVAGFGYPSFIHSNVLAPLGMHRSFHYQPLPDSLASNAATGHETTNEPVFGRWRIYPETAALGMWTTPSDLAKMILALQRACAGTSNQLLSQTTACEMLTRQFEGRGFGFEVGGEGDWRFFKLEGHGNNFLTELFAYVSQGMGAVVMTNSSNGEGVKVHILRAIAIEYGWPNLLPEELDLTTLPNDAMRELEGVYSFRGRDRVLRLEQGRLQQHSEGGPDQEIRALSDSLLVSVTFGYRYGIDRDVSGAITGLTLILNGHRLFTYEKTR